MKNFSKETVLALSAIACIFPFIYIFQPFLENAEPYNLSVFFSALMEGSIIGSIFGIISLICNRRIKSKKVYILSLVPIFTLLISLISDPIFFADMP